MFKVYIDGSGHGAKDFFVMAGYIAAVDQWEAFSTEWDQLLEVRPGAKRPFKMREMKNDPEMSSWFYRVIEKHAVAAVSCLIKTKELVEVVREFPWPFKFDKEGTKALENPYYFAFRAIMQKLIEQQGKLGITEPIDFVFDEDTEKNRCLSAWDRLRYDASADIRRLLGDTPDYKNDATTLPLQAADLYAYWVRDWELQGIENAIATMPFPWKWTVDMPRVEIRFERADFVSHFQQIIDDPETLRRSFMKDEEITQALKGLQSEEREYMAVENELKQQVESFRSSTFVKLYANNVQIEFTPWDFQLTFGDMLRDNTKMRIEQSACVLMSPQHAKALSQLLARHVREYEQRIGDIKLPQPSPEPKPEEAK
jgi:hypothetical protein